MDAEKWLEAANGIETDISRLKTAAMRYRENAEQGVPWPASSDTGKDTATHCLIREPQTQQAANEQAHGCISILRSE